MPRARETFGENLADKATKIYGADSPEVKALRNARIEVRGRGTFFTDQTGRVVFVEPMRRQFTSSWNPLARPLMSTDLRNPLPETTYLVDNRTFFHTNANGWTDHVHVTGLSNNKVPRGWAAQRNVSGGLPDIDAGHVDAHARGGTGEEINLVKMVQDFNRGSRDRSLANGNNWAELERLLQRRFDHGDIDAVDLRIRYGHDPTAPSTWQSRRALSNRGRLAPQPTRILVEQHKGQREAFPPLTMINK